MGDTSTGRTRIIGEEPLTDPIQPNPIWAAIPEIDPIKRQFLLAVAARKHVLKNGGKNR